MLWNTEIDSDQMAEFGKLLGARIVIRKTIRNRFVAWWRGEKLVDYRTLLNAAFTFYKWCAKEQKGGRVITSMDEPAQTYRVLESPALPNR